MNRSGIRRTPRGGEVSFEYSTRSTRTGWCDANGRWRCGRSSDGGGSECGVFVRVFRRASRIRGGGWGTARDWTAGACRAAGCRRGIVAPASVVGTEESGGRMFAGGVMTGDTAHPRRGAAPPPVGSDHLEAPVWPRPAGLLVRFRRSVGPTGGMCGSRTPTGRNRANANQRPEARTGGKDGDELHVHRNPQPIALHAVKAFINAQNYVWPRRQFSEVPPVGRGTLV